MRKILKSKKGDISAPIIAVLLIIASISIATLIISWMYGIGTTASKQGNLSIVGTPVIQGNKLYITIKNNGNVDVTIKNVIIEGVAYTINNVILPSETKTLNVTVTTFTTTQVEGILETDAGMIPFIAVVQS